MIIYSRHKNNNYIFMSITFLLQLKFLGSPVTFIAQESGVPKVDGPGLYVAQIGNPTTFKIQAKGLWGHPQVAINGKMHVSLLLNLAYYFSVGV